MGEARPGWWIGILKVMQLISVVPGKVYERLSFRTAIEYTSCYLYKIAMSKLQNLLGYDIRVAEYCRGWKAA